MRALTAGQLANKCGPLRSTDFEFPLADLHGGVLETSLMLAHYRNSYTLTAPSTIRADVSLEQAFQGSETWPTISYTL